jgi:hypothetical protein
MLGRNGGTPQTLPLPEPTTVVAPPPASELPAASSAASASPAGQALVPSPTVTPAAAGATVARGGAPASQGATGATGVTGQVPAGSNVARGAAPGATPGPPTGARGTPHPTPDAAPASPPAGSTDTTLATFSNVRIYTVNDKRTLDREVTISFIAGQVQVVPRTGGAAIATVPYQRILRATYNRGSDPKWDASLPGPPDGLDVGTFMRQTRHWLVVQGAENFAVLRLEDNNFRQILETFEQRTGIKVERRAQ